MKKILLTTTALSMFAAGSAFAEGPTVTLGGNIDFQVGGASQENQYESPTGANVTGANSTRKTHSRVEADVVISVDGKADNGIGYGGKIVLNADPSQPEGTQTTDRHENASEVSIYVDTAYGHVEAGALKGVASKLKVDAGNIARASGGIEGDFHEYATFNGSGTANNDSFILTPDLPSVAQPGDVSGGAFEERAKANKIAYYSPRIYGFQGGVSYTQDQDEKGNSTAFSGGTDDAANDFEHLWELGLHYQGQYDQIGVEASAVAEFADNETDNLTAAAGRDDLEAYELGLSVNYAGFTLAGSWADIDEFGQTSSQNQEANYWTLGGAYEFGPFAASITYLDSEVENQEASGTGRVDAEFTNLVIGADYQLAPGLVPYVEVAFFDTDDNVADTATSHDNEGTIVIVGTELSF